MMVEEKKQEFHHVPIMFEDVIEGLKIRPDGIYCDGTLGGGGHSSGIAEKLGADGRLIGIDQDIEAIAAATKRLSAYPQVTIVKDNYRNMKAVLETLGIRQVEGILLDLGVSSWQLDSAERGFSYRNDAPLDMRMDQSGSLTAKDIVNGYEEKELIRILRTYGEEPFAGRIASAIVRARDNSPIETTTELSEIVKAAIPAAKRREGGHPAKRTFQAIRIEVNGELMVLSEALSDLIGLLSPGGRLLIITFHSLEDRIVKQAFKEAENPCICPPNFPVCTCGKKPLGRMVTRKPIEPSEEEKEKNPRAKSAKLRIFEKT